MRRVNTLSKCGRVGGPLLNATDALQRGKVQPKVNKGSRKPSVIVRGHLWLHPEGLILKPRTKLGLNRTVIELQRLKCPAGAGLYVKVHLECCLKKDQVAPWHACMVMASPVLPKES